MGTPTVTSVAGTCVTFCTRSRKACDAASSPACAQDVTHAGADGEVIATYSIVNSDGNAVYGCHARVCAVYGHDAVTSARSGAEHGLRGVPRPLAAVRTRLGTTLCVHS